MQFAHAPVKKPPPRPTAPPARPAAPPSRATKGLTDPPKPSRPAPAPPGTDTDSDFFSSSSPVYSLASTVSNYSLACLTWPEDDDDGTTTTTVGYQPPPVPSRTRRSCTFPEPPLPSCEPPQYSPPSLSPNPPPFSPPSLSSEPPPFSPPSPPSETSFFPLLPSHLSLHHFLHHHFR